ncbi:hypothetical protein V8F33_010681 [Rhypophila sp. PSN 637]
MGNSQSIGSGIGDIFWPDNPHRRDRAFELERDCRNAIDEFNNLKTQYDKDTARVKEVMDKYLKDHGFDSVAHLDGHVQGVLEGKELEDWKNLKTAYVPLTERSVGFEIQTFLSANNFISDLVLTITGLGFVAGAGIIGGLVLFGVMSGPVGWAALGTVGAIAAVIGGIVIIWGVIEGGIERSQLRDTISVLFTKREEVYCQLRTLQAYKSWIAAFEMFFLDEDLKNKPQLFANRYQDQFKADAARAHPSAVRKEMEDMDKRRQSWTTEDPHGNNTVSMLVMNLAAGVDTAPETPEVGSIDTFKRKIVVTEASGIEHEFHARILEQVGRHKCTFQVENTDEKWEMTAETEIDVEKARKVSLTDVRFRLVRLGVEVKVLEHCRMTGLCLCSPCV